MTETTTTQQPAGTNRMTFQSLLADATALGNQHGAGKDTWVKFLMRAAEGGYHGAIDATNPDKHGAGIDDAQVLTEAYVKAQTGATIFDPKAPNQRKASSCCRTMIKTGSWTKGGAGEPLASMNNLMSLVTKLRKIPGEIKKLDDPSNSLLRWARAQSKQDRLIDDAGLKQFVYKKDTALRTPEQIIDGCRKELRNLIAGKCSQGTAQDASSFVKEAVKALDQRMAEIAKARAPANHVAPAKAPAAKVA